MKFIGIIPARYHSKRLPGKPLIDLLGKTMIERVVNQCKASQYLSRVIVGTEDERIVKAVSNFGGEVLLTSSQHHNGTNRCLEVYQTIQKKYDYIINIQGDEPLISPKQIDSLCAYIEANQPEIATMTHHIFNQEEIQSPNVVKCVTDLNGKALYFSRSPIPFPFKNNKQKYLQQIGIYGFRADIFQKLKGLPKSHLELTEGLEQLRWLENGFSISTVHTNQTTFGIDVEDDIKKVLQILNNHE